MRKLIFSISGIFILILLVGSLFVSFQGCNKDEISSPTSNNIGTMPETACPEVTIPIYAGAPNGPAPSLLVGNIIVWNDAVNLYVKYLFNSPYTAEMLHLWVGCDINKTTTSLPLNPQGTPIPGQFPLSFDLNGGNTHTFTIPQTSTLFSGCGGVNWGCPNPATIYIVAHCEVGSQTGFSYKGTNCGGDFGTLFGSNRWGWVSCYTICCDPFNEPPPPPEYSSETAFAKPLISQGGYVWTFGPNSNPESYPTLTLNRNRWGWAGKITKTTLPLEFELWAGCGLNNTSNGVLVGNVTITPTGTITYTATGGCLLSEVHVYLGAVAPTTIAPGQYGNTYYFDPAVTNWSGNFTLPGDTFFWFIGHAVVKIPIPPTK
jgi:hypothetical protein